MMPLNFIESFDQDTIQEIMYVFELFFFEKEQTNE